MRTFEFGDRLTANTFAGGNIYAINDLVNTELSLRGETGYQLFIERAGRLQDGVIVVSNAISFGGKTLNNAKVAEIFDSAQWPIKIILKEKAFYIGKGIIGVFEDIDKKRFRVLVAACIQKSIETTKATMRDIRFIVDKEAVKSEEFSAIKTVLKDVITAHPGEILYTEQMHKYFIKFQFIPDTIVSVVELNRFKNDLIVRSIRKATEEVDSLQLLG
jgi:hypothetical protein